MSGTVKRTKMTVSDSSFCCSTIVFEAQTRQTHLLFMPPVWLRLDFPNFPNFNFSQYFKFTANSLVKKFYEIKLELWEI